jgi:hypothetical protein
MAMSAIGSSPQSLSSSPRLAAGGAQAHTHLASKPPSCVLCLVFEAASEPPASAGRQDMAGHSVDNDPTHLEAKWCLDIDDAFDAIIHDFRHMILLTLFLSVVADHYNIL